MRFFNYTRRYFITAAENFPFFFRLFGFKLEFLAQLAQLPLTYYVFVIIIILKSIYCIRKGGRKLKITSVLAALTFAALIIIRPELCAAGAAEGLLLCGRVLIPSLFPMTVCTLFITGSGAFSGFKKLSAVTQRLFRLSAEEFITVILSLIGGYPVGAKLLNEAVKENRIAPEKAGIMLCYCVNSGPAFAVLAVGVGMYSSKAVGFALLAAHLLPSLIMCILFSFFIKKDTLKTTPAIQINVADNFVSSVSGASGALLSICAWVIFFSALGEYMSAYAVRFPWLKYAAAPLEVTNAVAHTRSLPLTAFLLGFAGISIWCQILSMGKSIKINFPLFLLARIFHGLLSVLFLRLILRIFKITVKTAAAINFSPTYGSAALSLSMLIMVMIFIISVYTKKSTGKLLDDIV